MQINTSISSLILSMHLSLFSTDVIDIVNNDLSGNDYKKGEDPSLYSSKKTGRGPLNSDWISNPPQGVIMCAYKLIKVGGGGSSRHECQCFKESFLELRKKAVSSFRESVSFVPDSDLRALLESTVPLHKWVWFTGIMVLY